MVLQSHLGEGTTFEIYLPLVVQASDTAPAPLDSAAIRQRPERVEAVVVYVDDDEIMRLTAEALLRRAGHKVIVFSSARAALRALRKPEMRCDLVVTDYNMPHMSGLDLAAALQRLRPRMPVVISSGFLTPALIDGAEAVHAVLLKKEECYERLAPLAAEVLESRREDG